MTADTCPCAPCAIAAELTQHRNQTAARWGQRRIVLNFAATIAAGYCTNTKGDTT